MRKLVYILISAMACLPVFGQEVGNSILLTNPVVEASGAELSVAFRLKASELRLSSDDMVTLEFAVEDNENRLVLPVVIYTGDRRYQYEQRRSLLSEDFAPAPYHIYKGVEPRLDYLLQYNITMPWQNWMDNAALTWCEYRHDCSGEMIAGRGFLVAEVQPAPDEPAYWTPDMAILHSMVNFMTPEIEVVKERATMIELRIGFPVNDTRVHPEFGNNRMELMRADSLVAMLNANTLIDINGVSIHGYASPEGFYDLNKRLASGRSESFKNYLSTEYPYNHYIAGATTSWTPEDWDGVGRVLEQVGMPSKNNILAVVNDPTIDPDAKSRILMDFPWWRENRKHIENTVYPDLRRIELKVDYTVENLSDDRARGVLYTDPKMLSVEEMYRVAQKYQHGSPEWLEIYETAARTFPDDIVANNNAAAALLQQGLGERAYQYLCNMGVREEAYINLGAYYYVMGDMELAAEYFEKAKQAGQRQGETNLQKIK